MSNYLDLSIKEINNLLKSKKIKPIDLVEEAFDRIEKSSSLNCFITLNKEAALKQAKELEDKEVDNLFFGIPIAIKDNICTKGLRTTCASKMLENFEPIYDATVIEKINEKHMIIIGKTNMDEFAMGSCSKTSYFGAPRNPWNESKITGGSSGGSAACVSGRLTPIALGSDTGGSIRQPSSFCGVVGLKPTYGRVSRFGLIAYGSSLDQIGPITRNVEENAELLNIICGKDEKDLTSAKRDSEDFTRLIGKDIKGMKIAVPNYFVSDIVSKEVLDVFNKTVETLRNLGCTVDYIDMKYLENVVTIYQIITMAEASGNLARFDGVKYGYSYPNPKDLEELYTKTRQLGFGDTVKKRIMVGSFILSGENAKIYYDKALSIRDDIKKSFDMAFEKYDFVIGPVVTSEAYDLDEEFPDPSKSFMDDVLVMPVNMAGLPGLSLPVGFSPNHLPIGLHVMAPRFEEAKLYQFGAFLEKELNLNLDPRGDKNE
ncbi:MAG: Asp-tRNA(Asn)/Glu-tRNA(Gln) amidotransferase subunit GatA [Bacilli bacterium]|nr:Asp-tRNA(Asn)/Glu-tRNA(Gln) amidotransferase subunit GatA [Bacilli bacterium]